MSKRKKSIFDRALGGSTKSRGKKRSLADLAVKGIGGGRKRKEPGGSLVQAFERRAGLGKAKRSRGGISDQAVHALRRRFSPTERLEVREAAEQAIEDNPQLQAQAQDQKLRGNDSFLRQLLTELVKRFRR